MTSRLTTPARSAVRSASDVYGRLTAGSRVLPDFLIVGGQRCGTTTLFKTLVQHPLVLPPTLRKGVHFFDIGYQHGVDWYRAHFPMVRTVESLRRRHGQRPMVGESSPYYLWHPLAAERIARDLPKVRLLVVLRDPVERAYSAHSHELARGYETETFEGALDLEPERLAGEEERLRLDPTARSTSHQHHAYVGRGQYVDQLERLTGHVPRDRVHVVDSHEFWSDPATHWPAVANFLDLPATQVSLRQHNARDRSPMSPELRLRLEEHFAPYDERLAQWWGHVPSWRR